MTYRKAKRLHIKLWTWLAETGASCKDEWPEAEKYELDTILNKCFLCEATKNEDNEVVCEICPLYKEQGCYCAYPESLYSKWGRAKTKRTKRKYAALIVDVVKNNRFGR